MKLTAAQMARRLEIGEERRARTRARLMEAAYQLFAVRGADAPTIDDVVAQADVARGTFYNHFQTRDELFRAVADDISAAIGVLITPLMDRLQDPAMRVALSFRMFVHFAVAKEARGWILLRTMPLFGPINENVKDTVHREFSDGLKAGRFRGVSTHSLVDLGIGLEIMTINRILTEGMNASIVDQAAETLLIAFGVDQDEAQTIAHTPIEIGGFSEVA